MTGMKEKPGKQKGWCAIVYWCIQFKFQVPSLPMTAVTQATDVYHQLLQDIASGVLQPGERLREQTLAERLAVSRTPVREALKALEGDGLVEHVPRVGAAIKVLTHAEVVELYEMRTVLEGAAAKLAARSATDLELQELRDINARMAQALSEPDRMAQLNRTFHRTLFNAAKNRYLLQAVSTVQRAMLVLGPSTLTEELRAQAVIEEHEAVLTALGHRSPAQAELAMMGHIEASHKARLQQLSERLTKAGMHPG
jgi:DNA-binding GntR family transcriptional regulator